MIASLTLWYLPGWTKSLRKLPEAGRPIMPSFSCLKGGPRQGPQCHAGRRGGQGSASGWYADPQASPTAKYVFRRAFPMTGTAGRWRGLKRLWRPSGRRGARKKRKNWRTRWRGGRLRFEAIRLEGNDTLSLDVKNRCERRNAVDRWASQKYASSVRTRAKQATI